MTGASPLPWRTPGRVRHGLALAGLALLAAAAPAVGQRVDRGWREADTLPAVDVAARYEAFERAFEEEFGRGGVDPTVARLEVLGERWKRRLLTRFEGSPLLGWYRGAERLYERLSDRLADWTSWSAGGFELGMDVESAVDGTGRVRLERPVGDFHLGLDLNDVAEGTLGLRVGGEVLDTRVFVYAGDLIEGRWRFGARWRGWGIYGPW